MTDDGGVPVRCPACRREHLYAPPPYPCACGAPVIPPVAQDAMATPVTDRAWADEWITVHCDSCGKRGEWPQPELDCPCGTVLRVPVDGGAGRGAGLGGEGARPAGTGGKGRDATAGGNEGRRPAEDDDEGRRPAEGDETSGTEVGDNGGRTTGAGGEGRDAETDSDEARTAGSGGEGCDAVGGGEARSAGAGGGNRDATGGDGARAAGAHGGNRDATGGDGARAAGVRGGNRGAQDGDRARASGGGGEDARPLDRPPEGGDAGGGEGGGGEGGGPGDGAGGEGSRRQAPRAARRSRPAFRPVAIRDARDAVTVVALYLRWLGYLNTRSAARRPPSGSRISARGMLAQVDPALRPTTLRDVECLWLTAMTESGDTPVACAFFSLAGYTAGARAGADTLGVPLFTVDPTGTPQPVNSAADELVATGA